MTMPTGAVWPRVWLARGFLGATLIWMLVLVLVPFLLAHEPGGRGVRAASAGTYLVGSLICHQRPDRSFRPWGVQMPVCARCAGLYLGAAVGALLAWVRRPAGRGTARTASRALRMMVLAAAVPTGATWLGPGWVRRSGGWCSRKVGGPRQRCRWERR